MRVLMVHNAYKMAGGEDAVVRDEIGLLRQNGVEVSTYQRHNDEIDESERYGPGSLGRLRLAADTVWSHRTVSDMAGLLRRLQPQVIHAHNTFPLISPSLYHAARQEGIPVVQTLHNFRLSCPQAMFMREGKVCEDCLGTLPWRGVLRGCYRDSPAQSAVLFGMLGTHRLLGTYRNHVSRYVALNAFCRDKFVQAGLPRERIAIKPNFVALHRPALGFSRNGGLFVGRLSEEKGIMVLRDAAAVGRSKPIEVLGTGPGEAQLIGQPGLRLAGWQAPDVTYSRMRRAAYLVMPSLWYENFPRTLVEAFACALPVIASRLGAMADLIRDGQTGLLFEPGNARELAAKMLWADSHPQEMARMGQAARREYEARYTPQINFAQLMDIYAEAIEEKAGAVACTSTTVA